MPRTKGRSKRRARKEVAPAMGVAGVMSLLLAGITSAATTGSADLPPRNTALPQVITLGEEEITDVSLSTFRVFDKEGTHPWGLGKVARCRGCGGCRCGYCRGSCRCGSCRGCSCTHG